MKLILILTLSSLLHCGPKLATNLHIISIQTDSQLRSAEAPWEHDPLNLLDENTKTAWCADGENGSITLKLAEPIEIDSMEIINGNGYSSKASLSNAQVSKLSVTGKLEGKGSDSIPLSIQKVSFDGTGKPKSEILKLGTSLRGDQFEIKILESVKGITSMNVCITEIKLGYLKGDKMEVYTPKDKSIFTEKGKEYDKSKKHSQGWNMLSKYSHGGSLVDFCDIVSCMIISLSPDGTFTFGDVLLTNPPPDTDTSNFPNYRKSVTGSYKVESIHPENGVEISFKFYDPNNIEITELWYLKNIRKGDKEFDSYKTIMGENFKIFDSKNYHLLYFESKADNSYHKEMKFFNSAVPLKITAPISP